MHTATAHAAPVATETARCTNCGGAQFLDPAAERAARHLDLQLLEAIARALWDDSQRRDVDAPAWEVARQYFQARAREMLSPMHRGEANSVLAAQAKRIGVLEARLAQRDALATLADAAGDYVRGLLR